MRCIDALRLVGGGSGVLPAPATSFTTDRQVVGFLVIAPIGTTLSVNWGDGSAIEDFAMTNATVTVSHDYGTSTIRTITFGGNANAALTYLNCSNSSLTTLDVSANVALNYLYCGSNSLTTLDVSANTALVTLNCPSNSLTTLDVSANVALTYLNCSSNSLTTLDVSTNVALNYLNCNTNSLTTTVINSHMASLVSAGLSNGAYSGNIQDPLAPPSGQGITDKDTLITRGWVVTTD